MLSVRPEIAAGVRGSRFDHRIVAFTVKFHRTVAQRRARVVSADADETELRRRDR